MFFSKKIALLFFVTFIFSNYSYAEELYDPFVPVRPMGMGGASTAVANDQNSIWTNPAGVSRIRKARARSIVHFFSFPGLVIGANKDGQSIMNHLQNSNSSSTMAQNIEKSLSGKNAGSQEQPVWARLSIHPIIFLESGKNAPIGIGAIAGSTMKLIFVEENGSNTVQITNVFDIGGHVSLAWTDRNNRVSFGLQLRPTARYAYDDKIDISTLTDAKALEKRIKNESNAGNGIGVDAGFMWTFADFWFPTIAAAAYNLPTGCKEDYLNPFTETRQKICGTVYSGSVNNPESLYLVDPVDLRVGVSIVPRLSNKIALRFAIDMHHLYFASGSTYYGLPGADPIKQTHAGVELFLGNPLKINDFAIRGGVNQGYPTVGATAKISFLAAEFALFGKDISSSASQSKDQRAIFSLSGDF